MMTTKDPSVRWISNAYYWVFHFFSIFFSKFGVYTKGRAKVVGYVLERDKSPNLPRFSELSIGRVGANFTACLWDSSLVNFHTKNSGSSSFGCDKNIEFVEKSEHL